MIDIQGVSQFFALNKKVGRKKSEGHICALNNVSLQLREGEITGLLGLNGAGKSTLMRLIYGLLLPSEGSIKIDGIDVQQHPDAARRLLGVLPDDSGLYKRLTARENIHYFGELQGLAAPLLTERCEQLIQLLGMQAIADRPCDGFSLGERMKTALARALIHNPKYILLDEPTNGLDVLTTRAVRQLLHELKAQGRGVLFSSHLMHEVSGLCDRIVVIAEGRICADGRLEDILAAGRANNLEDAFVNLVQQVAQEKNHVAAV